MKKIIFIASVERVFTWFYLPMINTLHESNFEIKLIGNFSKEFIEIYKSRFQIYNLNIVRGGSVFNFIYLFSIFLKIFRSEKPHIIQFTGPLIGLLSSLTGILCGINKRIYNLWGLRYEGFKGLKRILFKFIESISCFFSTLIISDSKANISKIKFDRIINKKKKVITILDGSAVGINFNIFNIENVLKNSDYQSFKHKYKDYFIFGYIGRLSEEKNTTLLINSFANLSKKYDKILLYLVGFFENEKYRLNVSDIIQKNNNILLHSYTNTPELFYPRFDCFVFPSIREGFGGGVIQAGAFSIPSIVSNIRPLIESVNSGSNGLIFDLKSPISLLNSMELMYKRKNYKDFSLNSRKFSEKFDQSLWLNDYKKLIINL